MPTYVRSHFNAHTSNPPLFTRAQALLVSCTVSFRSVKRAASGYHTQISRLLPSSFLNHIVVSFHSLPLIVLSRLRSSICIPRCDVITRILLQCVGLCLRALRIELLAKLAFALRCLGSFLVVREHGQLSVMMLKM